MNFLYPQFLWALLAIAIPIIIHLFNFKKFKKVYFSDLRLLKEVEMETSKKSNLKHLLILLSRILAIAALVFAFAQPFFPSKMNKVGQGEKLISVYIDNSFSMSNVSQEFTLLDQAKQKADNIAQLYKQSDKFQLITNDFELKHQRFVTKQEFVDLIQEIEVSSSSRLMSEVEQKQLDFLNKEFTENKLGYFVSDFQKTTADVEQMKLNTTILSSFIHLKPEITGNVFIDSVWFDSPVRVIKKKENITAKLVNNTEDDIQVKTELIINGKTESFVNQDIKSNSETEIVMSYTKDKPGLVSAKLKISEYPNPNSTFDDEFYFSYLLEESAKILVINNNARFQDNVSGNINQLFSNDPYFKIKNSSASAIDFSEFSGSGLIILNELNEFSSGLISELLKYLETGGSVLYFPGSDVKLNSVNEFLLAVQAGRFVSKDTTNTKVSYLNFEHPIFKDLFQKVPKNIDLPVVSNSYKFSSSSRARVDKLMKLQTGNDFLNKFSYKSGQVYVFTVPLDKSFSNLASHSIFVTSLLRIAENSGSPQSVGYLVTDESIVLKDKEYLTEEIHIQNKEMEIDVIPEIEKNRGELQLFLPKSLTQSGNYNVTYKGKNIAGFGLNYNRLESEFGSYDLAELKKLANGAVVVNGSEMDNSKGASSLSMANDTKCWKWFVLAAIIFLAFEILLIKLFK